MTTIRILGPSDVDYFDRHTDEALQTIVDRYCHDSIQSTSDNGPEHPVTVGLLRIWAAACGQQVKRGILR